MDLRLNSLHERDIAAVLHPYTNLSLHRTEGPLVIARGDGIHVYRIDAPGADWTHVQHLDGLANPSLFTPRPDGRVLYSVHGGRDHVSAFGIAPETGRLTLLSQMPCQGNNPVDAALPPGARHLVVANYGSGSVAVTLPLPSGALVPMMIEKSVFSPSQVLPVGGAMPALRCSDCRKSLC